MTFGTEKMFLRDGQILVDDFRHKKILIFSAELWLLAMASEKY